MKKNVLFIIIFIVFSLSTITILSYFKNNTINNHLQSMTQNYANNYNALYHEHKILSNVIYKTSINTDRVLSIFKNAYSTSGDEQKLVREKLYRELQNTYDILKGHHVKQLHFHLPNNESFLRFHKPEKYGDDLTDIRETVEYVNRTRKPIDGFEEGRLYNGYRFVFPLFHNDMHIGSVEVSYSSLSISLEFINDYKVFTNLLISKENIDKKVWQSEKSNYMPSPFKEFYLEKKMVKKLKEITTRSKANLSKETKDIFNSKWNNDLAFSIYDTNLKEVITFIKIKNPVSKKIVAIFTLRSSDTYINSTKSKYTTLFIVSTLFIIVVLFLLYKETNYRNQIEQNNKKLSSIFKNADSGIALMDLDGNFLEVNQVYSDLLGYSADELTHLNCSDITSPDTHKISEKMIKDTLAKGSVSKVRKICISKDARDVHLEFSLTLLPSKDAFIAVINSLEEKLLLEELNKDLNKRVHLEVEANRKKDEKLLQQSRLAQIGEMISMIAHQWRQPLGAISSTVIGIDMKLISGKYDIDDKVQREEFIELMKKKHNNINEYVDFLSTTIDDFRNFFKPDKKKELISLTTPIKRALQIVETSMSSKNIEMSYYFECQDKTLMYQNEMMQIILNLLKNAEDNFIEKDIQNRHIKISTLEQNNKYVISVYDNGGGITEDIIAKIFDPYFSTKNEKNGTGLGLYMSKTLIEDHHSGSLVVENIDGGVSFKIILPKDADA